MTRHETNSEEHLPPQRLSLAEYSASDSLADSGDWQDPPWAAVAARMDKDFSRRSLAWLFPDATDGGGILRWGLALACGKQLSALQIALSELASGCPWSKKNVKSVQWELAVQELIRDIDDTCASGRADTLIAAEAVLWAYALPPLVMPLRQASWTALCQSLELLARHCLADPDAFSSARLLGGCELALVLRLRLGDLIGEDLAEQAVDGLEQWCDAGEDSIGAALRGGGRDSRLLLASIVRQQRLGAVVAKRKLKKRRLGAAIDLGCSVAALTRRDGTAVFSSLIRSEVRDDWGSGGLLDAVKRLAPKLLGPAVDAVRGVRHSGGRLVWEVSLPETLWHSELAGTAAMLPQWDVRRGRTFVDYSQNDFRIEVEFGRASAVRGTWEVFIDVDGVEQAAVGHWTHVCEYSDDDAQYLEFEQRWSGGIRLQRQLMVLREDRCVLLADAVLRDDNLPSARIGYIGRVPLAENVLPERETETTEIWLRDAKERRRGLVLSLQSNEWRIGHSAARLELTPDQHLKLQTASQAGCENGGSVFAPLWFDFQPRRFDRPRTWRQLTVADDLRLVQCDEAVSQRIQMGSEQWVVYRSLRGQRTRTFLGKHLMADFYCARFHPGDGRMEDLLTVGDHDEDIEQAAAEAAGNPAQPQ